VAVQPVQTAPDLPNIPWRRIDLHLHTPGSHDYEEPDKTYLDILKQGEKRGLSIMAFTDHNTVNGYRSMMNEIEHLEYLEKLNRIRADELGRLNEYRRLLKKILVLPGFEFTATFGFHILGIFPPDKPLRDIERVLMELRVPGHVLDRGLTEAGATSDVLHAYELIDNAGGMAIAAHANSSNGVSMRGMSLGGQTRIAFTQDPHLRAIEFTDLEKGRYSSAHLFTGIKPEYPRRMFAIQGSDAHRIMVARENSKRLGVGERATEVQLEEVSFAALRDLFMSQDFARVRPAFNIAELPEDPLIIARREGASATAAFHAALPKRGERFEAVLKDAAAMANGEGGLIVIGMDASPRKKIAGVDDVAETTEKLAGEIESRIMPKPAVSITVESLEGKDVIRLQMAKGNDAPYTFDGAQFLVRDGVETRAATRDEIIEMARRGYEKPRPQEQPRHESRPHQQHQPRQTDQHRQQRSQGERPQGERQQGNQQPRQPDQQSQQRQADPQRQPRPQGERPQGERPQGERQQGERQQGNQQPRQPDQQNQQRQPRPQGERQQRPSDQQRAQQPPQERIEQLPPRPEPAGALPAPQEQTARTENGASQPKPAESGPLTNTPRTGVTVTAMEERNGVEYFTVRDLRNNSVIRNVTRKSARDLWQYAITQYAEHPQGPADIDWRGDRAVLGRELRAGKVRNDVAMRDANGNVQVFYGVTDDGLDGTWKQMITEYAAAHPVEMPEEAPAESAPAPAAEAPAEQQPQ
jgi:hypothetical protein